MTISEKVYPIKFCYRTITIVVGNTFFPFSPIVLSRNAYRHEIHVPGIHFRCTSFVYLTLEAMKIDLFDITDKRLMIKDY